MFISGPTSKCTEYPFKDYPDAGILNYTPRNTHLDWTHQINDTLGESASDLGTERFIRFNIIWIGLLGKYKYVSTSTSKILYQEVCKKQHILVAETGFNTFLRHRPPLIIWWNQWISSWNIYIFLIHKIKYIGLPRKLLIILKYNHQIFKNCDRKYVY